MWCRKLLLAICFEILLCDYTITHWLLTLKTLRPVSTLMMNTCAKFHSDPSTNFGDITSCKIGVNGQQTTDGGTTWMHDALCLLLLAEAWKFGENKNKQACQLNIWCVFCIIVFFFVLVVLFLLQLIIIAELFVYLRKYLNQYLIILHPQCDSIGLQ